jgi:tetratricopeptide (TPR) repeat protein
MRQQRISDALELSDRATKADPQSKRAWLMAGSLRIALNQEEQGLANFRKAIEIDPKDAMTYKVLGFTLMDHNRLQEATQVWRDLLKQDPNERDAHANLGTILLHSKKYGEAVPELEAALNPDKPSRAIQTDLANAYFGAGDNEKAVAAIRKAVAAEPKPGTWNDAAYYLADHNVELAEAQEYGEKAVQSAEEATKELALDQLGVSGEKNTRSLAYYWDTLGWVYFRQGKLEKAEKYIQASWGLSQKSIVADHLGQVYEKQGKKPAAIRMYAAAVDLSPAATEARERLLRLAGTKLRADAAVSAARERLSEERSVALGKPGPQRGTAQFLVLFTAGPKVEQVKFLEGPEDMRSLGKAITTAKFDVSFPDDAPTRLVRQGMVYCGQISGCQFVFMPLDYTP